MGDRDGRLRRKADFERVFAQGRAVEGRLAVLRFCRGTGRTRVAVAVGRRLGSAVHRNRLRRRWREVIRLGPPLSAGYDVVVVARGAGERAGAAELRRAWADALARAGLSERARPGGGGAAW